MIESLYSIPFVGHLNKITDKKKENTWNKKKKLAINKRKILKKS